MMLLDEFTALGRIPIIAEAISYLPGYNVRVVLVIQTPAQLREVYGIHNAETMLKSLAARIVFAPKDFSDAREISDELGFTTVPARTVSKPLNTSLERRGGRSRSESVSEQRRALLLPQEVKELGAEEAIVFYEGLRPIRCRKIRYFAEKRFRRRLLPAPRYPTPNRCKPPTLPSSSGAQSVPADAVPAGAPSSAAPKEAIGIRDGTLADVERIDSLTREDFAADLDQVGLPTHDGPVSHDELHVAARQFVDLLKAERSVDRGR
jgi:type IV secretion system protein VirD4